MATTVTQQRTPERTNRLILLGAVILAAIAAVLVFATLANFGGGDSTPIGATTNVVTATKDVKAGAALGDLALQISAIPRGQVLDGAITDTNLVKGLTARYPLQKGEQITAAKIGQTPTDKVFAGVIPAGKRAVALPVTETTSVGGLIVAGDHVDITAVTKQGSGAGQEQASTLLQNIEVLAVAQTTQKPTVRLDKDGNPVDSNGTRPDNTEAKPTAKTITVAVDPKEVSIIALAQQNGTIFLSLRPVGDDSSAAGVDAPRTLPNQQPTTPNP